MAREWAEVPAYRESLAETLGEEGGAEFLRRGRGARPGSCTRAAARLFENWLDLAAA